MKTIVLSLFLSASFVLGSTAQAADSQGKVVWDYWYTVSVNTVPAQYYNEHVVLRDGKLQFFNHVWKKEEGFLNQEQLGAFAIANMDLTPLFFNFRSTYRTSETVVDGNVKDGNMIVKVRRDGQELPTVNKSITKKTFFSVFFPFWLSKELPVLKENQTVSFSTILEDDVEHGFDSESGTVRLEPSDDLAKKTGTKKIAVDYRDVRSYWWVDARGAPVRTEMPETKAVIERVTKEKAEAFLK